MSNEGVAVRKDNKIKCFFLMSGLLLPAHDICLHGVRLYLEYQCVYR